MFSSIVAWRGWRLTNLYMVQLFWVFGNPIPFWYQFSNQNFHANCLMQTQLHVGLPFHPNQRQQVWRSLGLTTRFRCTE